jgi:hypothetical protein
MKENEQEMQDLNESISRRGLLGRMAALAISAVGVSALAPVLSRAAGPRWNGSYVLDVDFEINQPSGGRYHRPYVAVWIEDKDTATVRTLSLWVQKTGRGPRWIPDLKRWFRDEKERKVLEGGDLAKTISAATRAPGRYSLTWDGRDDQGQVVPQGDYILCIEAAREHGTYQLMRASLPIGSKPFRKSLDGNIEIKGATVAYRKR